MLGQELQQTRLPRLLSDKHCRATQTCNLSVVLYLVLQCRVEGNPQNRMQFRVTVAAPDAMLAAGLRDMIAGQVLATP
jgi:hypothetical protein